MPDKWQNPRILQLVWTHPLVSTNFYDILPFQTRNSASGAGSFTANSLLPSLIDAHSLLKLDLGPGNTNTTDPTYDKLQQASPEIAKFSPESNESKSCVKIFSSDNFILDASLATTQHGLRVSEGGHKEWMEKDMSDDKISKEEEKTKKEELLKIKEEFEKGLQEKVDEFKSKKASIDKMKIDIETLTMKQKEMDEKVLKSKEELEKHQKILQLLPNAEENLDKLMSIVKKSKAKLEDLKQQWEYHKEKLDTEYNETNTKTLQLQKLSENKRGLTMTEKLENVDAVILEKEALHKNLLKILQSLKSDGQPREFYTNRILDLVKQIEKLRYMTFPTSYYAWCMKCSYSRSGVDKVIEDVKGVQKDINNQNGKLERTFIELSRMMQGKVNNKEPYVEQGLELTRRIHNNCYNIVETIR